MTKVVYNSRIFRVMITISGILTLISLLGSSCNEHTSSGKSQYPPEPFDIPYDLSTPDEKIFLPGDLTEISGIDMYSPDQLACVQDELGKLFFLDLQKKSIVRFIDFGKNGDYEDLVILDSIAYILRSDGTLFKVDGIAKQDPMVSEIRTILNRTNDAEGLCLGPDDSSLWIACKGRPGLKDGNPLKGIKSVYRFDLADQLIDHDPVIRINLKMIEDRMRHNRFRGLSANVGKRLGIIGDDWIFQPSAINIHPTDGNVYVLSHINKILLVIDSNDRYAVSFLDPGLFRQPEGITFSPSGDLYISNEGAGGKAVILVFKRKQ